MSTITEKSELLFLYESKYSTPNGDPFTGEQRYDEESKRVLVSDVRIKRFIRDYLLELGYEIFVVNDKSQIVSGAESGAASRLNALIEKDKNDPSIKNFSNRLVAYANQEQKDASDSTITESSESENSETLNEFIKELEKEKKETTDKNRKAELNKQIKEKKEKLKKLNKEQGNLQDYAIKLLQKCIDVRLFGGISTKEGMAVNITGPVQFALLNPSLNQLDLRIHQNTSVFSSSAEKSRGAIGTTSLAPYSLCQIHGWINPFSAKHSGLVQDDLDIMFAALWHSVNNANTRSKSNQSSLLMVQIVYAEVTDKLYAVDKLLSINTELNGENGEVISNKQEEQIRDWSDFQLKLEQLIEAANSDKVKAINYYTENKTIEDALLKESKFKKMSLVSLTPKKENNESSPN